MKNTDNRTRGSMAVETAIFLPMLIIGILTVGWLIRVNGSIEQATHVAADETALVCSDASIPISAVSYKNRVLSRLKDDFGSSHKDIQVTKYQYRIPWVDPATGRTYKNLVGSTVEFQSTIMLPKLFGNSLKAAVTVLGRSFVGADNRSEVMPFSEMEKSKDSYLVWVFPRAGERYHGENCRVIKTNAREMLLTAQLRLQFSPCKLCKPSKLSNGSLVYVFKSSAKAYHRGSCYLVDRYVISVNVDDAKEQGYTVCKVCGGK